MHFVRHHQLIIVLLFAMYIARWLLADWNSYWLDELLSVNVYGQWHETAAGAVRHLAKSSIHPPLYQLILYYWMELFGTTEIATRSLSNLYITLATLFLYMMLKNAASKKIAFASAAVFSVMYAPLFFALETRSYAQTIFLAVASSYFLTSLTRTMGTGQPWQTRPTVSASLGLIIANTALLLTHYYNVFVVAAQLIFLGVYLLRQKTPREWPSQFGMVGLLYIVQLALFGVIWGRVLIADIGRRFSTFELDGDLENPVSTLLNSVIAGNFEPPDYVLWFFLLGLAALLIRHSIEIARTRHWSPAVDRAWMLVYLLMWMIGPILVAHVAFLSTGSGRYNFRYVVFSVPPLAPLIVLTIEEVFRFIDALAVRLRRATPSSGWRIVAMLAAVMAWVLPGALTAATHVKHDWRGIVKGVVDTVEADPQHSYIIFEAAHRGRPLTNYYFERFSPSIRAYGTLQRHEETEGSYRMLTRHQARIAAHDYLILLFTHSLPGHFPKALEQLEDRYEVRHRQVNHVGRGYIVFEVDGE